MIASERWLEIGRATCSTKGANGIYGEAHIFGRIARLNHRDDDLLGIDGGSGAEEVTKEGGIGVYGVAVARPLANPLEEGEGGLGVERAGPQELGDVE